MSCLHMGGGGGVDRSDTENWSPQVIISGIQHRISPTIQISIPDNSLYPSSEFRVKVFVQNFCVGEHCIGGKITATGYCKF